MRWRMGWAGVLCAVLIGAVSAQTVPITTENAARVQEIARLGRGVIRTAAWSPDGSLLAVATTLGVWVESLLSPSPPTPLPQGERGVYSRVIFEKLRESLLERLVNFSRLRRR